MASEQGNGEPGAVTRTGSEASADGGSDGGAISTSGGPATVSGVDSVSVGSDINATITDNSKTTDGTPSHSNVAAGSADAPAGEASASADEASVTQAIRDVLQSEHESTEVFALALHAFDGQDETELSFPRNAVIHGVTTLADAAWLSGSYKGVVGIFPANYVSLATHAQLRANVGAPSQPSVHIAKARALAALDSEEAYPDLDGRRARRRSAGGEGEGEDDDGEVTFGDEGYEMTGSAEDDRLYYESVKALERQEMAASSELAPGVYHPVCVADLLGAKNGQSVDINALLDASDILSACMEKSPMLLLHLQQDSTIGELVAKVLGPLTSEAECHRAGVACEILVQDGVSMSTLSKSDGRHIRALLSVFDDPATAARPYDPVVMILVARVLLFLLERRFTAQYLAAELSADEGLLARMVGRLDDGSVVDVLRAAICVQPEKVAVWVAALRNPAKSSVGDVRDWLLRSDLVGLLLQALGPTKPLQVQENAAALISVALRGVTTDFGAVVAEKEDASPFAELLFVPSAAELLGQYLESVCRDPTASADSAVHILHVVNDLLAHWVREAMARGKGMPRSMSNPSIHADAAGAGSAGTDSAAHASGASSGAAAAAGPSGITGRSETAHVVALDLASAKERRAAKRASAAVSMDSFNLDDPVSAALAAVPPPAAAAAAAAAAPAATATAPPAAAAAPDTGAQSDSESAVGSESGVSDGSSASGERERVPRLNLGGATAAPSTAVTVYAGPSVVVSEGDAALAAHAGDPPAPLERPPVPALLTALLGRVPLCLAVVERIAAAPTSARRIGSSELLFLELLVNVVRVANLTELSLEAVVTPETYGSLVSLLHALPWHAAAHHLVRDCVVTALQSHHAGVRAAAAGEAVCAAIVTAAAANEAAEDATLHQFPVRLGCMGHLHQIAIAIADALAAGRITDAGLSDGTRAAWAAFMNGDVEKYRVLNTTPIRGMVGGGSGGGAGGSAVMTDDERMQAVARSVWASLPPNYDPADVVAVAQYPFESTEEGDIPFPRNAVITRIQPMSDPLWLEGQYGGKRGIFPTSFVVLTTGEDLRKRDDVDVDYVGGASGEANGSAPAVGAMAAESGYAAIALYPFDASHLDEISFRSGDRITNVEECENEDEWFTGTIDGRKGLFPSSFVRIISASELNNADEAGFYAGAASAPPAAAGAAATDGAAAGAAAGATAADATGATASATGAAEPPRGDVGETVEEAIAGALADVLGPQ